jgi:hypothetical protein
VGLNSPLLRHRYDQQIRQWIAALAVALGHEIAPTDIHLVSAKTGYGIKPLLQVTKIREETNIKEKEEKKKGGGSFSRFGS